MSGIFAILLLQATHLEDNAMFFKKNRRDKKPAQTQNAANSRFKMDVDMATNVFIKQGTYEQSTGAQNAVFYTKLT
jgi:hypothetical protein